jgi:adenine-specific DNA-methyltransferase
MNVEQTKPIPATAFAPMELRNAILEGDCTELLRTLPRGSADFVLTDPPYLVRYCSRDGRTIANDADGSWLEPAFAQIFRILRRDGFCVSFYGWSQADRFIRAWRRAGFRLAGHISFPKAYASTERFLRYHHENAYLLVKGNPPYPATRIPDVIEWKYSGNRLHPTQKPTCVLRPLIESFSRPGDLVVDPFCGSGSTLLAARLAGRRFLGIELDAYYCAVARRRLFERAA